MTFPTLVPYGDTLLMTNADETLDEILEFNIVKEQWKETSLDISDSWKNKIKNGVVTISESGSKSKVFKKLSCF